MNFDAGLCVFLQPSSTSCRLSLSSPLLSAPLLTSPCSPLPQRQARMHPSSPPPQPAVQSPCLKSHLRLFSAPSVILPFLLCPPCLISRPRLLPGPPAAAAQAATDTFIVPLALPPGDPASVRAGWPCVVVTPATCAAERRSHEALSSPPLLPCHLGIGLRARPRRRDTERPVVVAVRPPLLSRARVESAQVKCAGAPGFSSHISAVR